MGIPDILLVDFHGVLTDGKLNMTHDGKVLFESMHTTDTAAIRELVARGIEVYIVTASSNPIIQEYGKKVGVKVISNVRDKGEFVKQFGDKAFMAVGDTGFDIPMLKAAAIAFCPSNASDSVKWNKNVILSSRKGGEGVMVDILQYLYYRDGK